MINEILKEKFINTAAELLLNSGITSDKELAQVSEKFFIFYEYILEWNKKINLTAITDENEFIKRHILDSAFLLKILDKEKRSIIDIGSGAGFPGIILNILNPALNVISIDSVLKKCNFQKMASRKLGLLNFICLNLNIFSYKNFHNADAITTRAAFNVNELIGLIGKLDLVKNVDLYLFLSKTDEITKIETFNYKSKTVCLDRILYYKTDYNADKNSDFRLIAKFKAAPVLKDGFKKIF